MKRLQLGALVWLSLGLAACGGELASPNETASPAPAASVANLLNSLLPSPAAGGSPGAGSATPRTGGSPVAGAPGSSPTPNYPQVVAGSTPAPLTATLSQKCLTIGGAQTLTVVTQSNYFVAFDVQYSDGSDGKKHGGGWATEQIDGTGHYTKSWVLAPDVPTGDAIVFVAVSGPNNTNAFRQPHFMVAGSC